MTMEDRESVRISIGDESRNSVRGNTSDGSSSTLTTSSNTCRNNHKSFLSEVFGYNLGYGEQMKPHEHNEGLPHPQENKEYGHADRDVDELSEENKHEQQRKIERLAKFQRTGRMSLRRRTIGRRRKHSISKVTSSSSYASENIDGVCSSKENEGKDHTFHRSPHRKPSLSSSDEESCNSRTSASCSFLELHPKDKNYSLSTEFKGTPPLDLTTLHEQIGSSEPIISPAVWSYEDCKKDESDASCPRILSSSTSHVLRHQICCDIDAPPSPPHEHEKFGVQMIRSRLKNFGKKISTIKNKLRGLEQVKKVTGKEMKKSCTQLNKVCKGVKDLKVDHHDASGSGQENDEINSTAAGTDSSLKLEEALVEAQQRLRKERIQDNRPEILEEMTRDQILSEKGSIEKELLYLEDICGKSVTTKAHGSLKPLYNRYRMLKCMSIQMVPSKIKNCIPDLGTIHEYETTDFTSLPRQSLTVPEDGASLDVSTAGAAAPAADVMARGSTSSKYLSVSSDTLWENLHSLSLSELIIEQQSTMEEKKKLRRYLRDFEKTVLGQRGNNFWKEEQLPIEAVYSSYKHAKAKLRLLKALISKVST